MVMMFSYWDKPDQSPIAAFVQEWRSHFPDFRILSDPDVEVMIAEHFPQHLEMFRRIRIPTCKSDITILLSLHCHGGLFVDCHCGITDADGLLRLVAASGGLEVTLHDK